ncbi:CdaR family protein [Olleya aquimaris]|uniref:YbbR-like protein n=1 Tax=Olleya aquimaris TaxID=639310 RepID=A0A327RNJ4_9FLAO|nr:YbbR-like domain-containing protein [Olleya aquimaris]RAJ17123.1 YbbR-like protein [Olleya aquimaris]
MLKSKILGLFKSKKLNMFLLFLILAFSILILTKLSKTYTATIAFKVHAKHVNDTHVIVNSNATNLNITLETFGFKWVKYAFKRPELDISLKNEISKQDSTIVWSASKDFSTINNQFDKDVKIISIQPETLVFKFDINAVKYVPIKLDANIQYAQGYNTLDEVKTNPDSIKLIGPSSVLNQIKHIQTQKISLESVKNNINQNLLLKLDSLNRTVKTDLDRVNLSIKVSKFSEDIVSLPIEIINIPNGKSINYFPKQVSLSYTTSLENYKNITNQDFKVVCNFEEAIDNSYLTPYIVKQPKDVKNARLLQQKIEFIITE